MGSSCKKLGCEGERGEQELERVSQSRLKMQRKGLMGGGMSCGHERKGMRGQP